MASGATLHASLEAWWLAEILGSGGDTVGVWGETQYYIDICLPAPGGGCTIAAEDAKRGSLCNLRGVETKRG